MRAFIYRLVDPWMLAEALVKKIKNRCTWQGGQHVPMTDTSTAERETHRLSLQMLPFPRHPLVAVQAAGALNLPRLWSAPAQWVLSPARARSMAVYTA